MRYTEGFNVGYKWFDSKHLKPLFPFGYGLWYSRFADSEPSAAVRSGKLDVGFKLRNTISRAGAEVAEIYLAFPKGCGELPKRLIGWARMGLSAGQAKTVSLHVKIKTLNLSVFVKASRWKIYPGRYTVLVGDSASSIRLSAVVRLP